MSKQPILAGGLRTLILLLTPVLLVACGGGPGGQQPVGSGLISGRLIMPQQTGFEFVGQASTQAIKPSGLAPIVPGEVLVGFDRSLDLRTASLGTLSVSGVQLTLQGGRDAAGYLHYTAPGLDEEQTRALVAELNEREDVIEAIPRWILSAYRTPTDAFAYLQWHYPALNLPAAWDIETGASNRITVAVVDSGGITDPNLHPDLTYVGGYNFVSGPNHGGPQPGWGPDFMDYSHTHPEYWQGGGSGFHGPHVAGTIGATTNNEVGLAGVNWNVDLVAVRSLGNDGSGTIDDIYLGAWWAAGGGVEGVPGNPNPARVVNMSLGAETDGACPQLIAEIFTAMAANGVITVVAAGNENMNTANIVPANCPGVITVGATDHTGYRAPYSNFGNEIDVMAPGGNMNRTFTDTTTGTEYPAGVLSTVLYHAGGANPLVPQTEFMQGTSMAAPHVAGVVSLMLARKPNLTFDQVVTQLRAAGRPLPAEACVAGNPGVVNPTVFCGTGLVDAAVALGGGGNPPGPNPPGPNPPGPNPPGPNPPGPNPPGPNPPGPGPVNPGQPIPSGNVYVAALFTNADGTYDVTKSAEVTLPATAGAQINYTLGSLQAGSYTVAAWQPLGNTGNIQPGEPFAMHQQLITIAAGQQVTNLDLYLQPYGGNAAAAKQMTELFQLFDE